MTAEDAVVPWGQELFIPSEREQRRLHLLAEVFDPHSIALLDRIGLSSGWHCLEVGAGTGSLLPTMAARVGAAGRVVATDLDTRFMDHHHGGVVEVVRHDVQGEEPPAGRFDLIHARLVLEHLPDRQRVVERLLASLSPDGVLCVEATSWVPAAAVVGDYGRALASLMAAGHRLLGSDLSWARTFPLPLQRVGLTKVEAEGRTVVVRGGTPHAELMYLTFAQPASAGLLPDVAMAQIGALLLDPTFVDHSATMTAAWGWA
ncbi:class I SAM-dependent methyltransferase [Longispora sp. NPDC051575]|uniref:class I SAM-dependent methyltransferase n=1 Tax=Longispora sp. NPDC051575 TaxID=3154943 RepID=UPI003448A17D